MTREENIIRTSYEVIEGGATKKLINKKVHKTKIRTEKFLESKPVPPQPPQPCAQPRPHPAPRSSSHEDWAAEDRLCEDDPLPGFAGIGKILPHIKEELETLGLESPLNSHSSHRWNRDSFRPHKQDPPPDALPQAGQKPYDAGIFFPGSQDALLCFRPTLLLKPQAEVEQLIALQPDPPPQPRPPAPNHPPPAEPRPPQLQLPVPPSRPVPSGESPGLCKSKAAGQGWAAKSQNRSKSNSLVKKHKYNCLPDLDWPRPADSSLSPFAAKGAASFVRSFDGPKHRSRTPGKPLCGSFASKDLAAQDLTASHPLAFLARKELTPPPAAARLSPGFSRAAGLRKTAAAKPFAKQERPAAGPREQDRRFPLHFGKGAQSYLKGGKKKLSVLQPGARPARREPNGSEEFTHHGAETVSFATVEDVGPFHGPHEVGRYFGNRRASPLRPAQPLESDPARELRYPALTSEYSRLLKSTDSQAPKPRAKPSTAADPLRNSSAELAKKQSLLSFSKPSAKVFELRPPQSPKAWQQLASPGPPARRKDFVKLNKQSLAGGISEYAKQLRQAGSGMLEKARQACAESPQSQAREAAPTQGKLLRSQGTATVVGDDCSVKNYPPSVASEAPTLKRPLTSHSKLKQPGPLHSSCFSKSSFGTAKASGLPGSRIEINLYGKNKAALFNERKLAPGLSASASQCKKPAGMYSPKR